MPRAISFEVPVDTSLFNPLQIQPRAALSLSFTALTHWLRAHLVAFPRLLGEWHSGVVFLGFDLQYEAKLGFFDLEMLPVTAEMKALRKSWLLGLEANIGPEERPAARVSLLMHPVRVVEPISLAAEAAAWPDELIARFRDDEWADKPPRVVPGEVARIEAWGKPRAEVSRRFVVHRHLCEVADQWFFAEIPRLLDTTREELALSEDSTIRQRLLGQPLRRLVAELYRPYYWLHDGELRSSVHGHGDELVVIHRLQSLQPVREACGIAIEYFHA